jgi:uncharacterized membrane protein YhiD involved in acid resistance
MREFIGKYWYVALILVLIGMLVFKHVPRDIGDKNQTKLDSINNQMIRLQDDIKQIDIEKQVLKDSVDKNNKIIKELQGRIHTVDYIKNENNKKYDKKIDSVKHLNDIQQVDFFTKYITKNSKY